LLYLPCLTSPPCFAVVLFFGMILCLFVGVCQAQNSEDVPVKQDRRAVNTTWVSSFALVSLVLLLFIVGDVSASKFRSWGKYPDLNPWSIGKPSERCKHTMVTDSDGALWVFGGDRPGSGYFGDLLKLDVETKQWTTITTSGVSPSARSGHTMVTTDGRLWVFGGSTLSGDGETSVLDDAELWTLSLVTLEWTSIEVETGGARPSSREGHVMTSVGLDLWVHGGYGSPGGHSAELWRFSTSTRGWERVDSTDANGARPSARRAHVMTSVGLDLWLHGGYAPDSGEGDTCATHVALMLLSH
jgi:hypothetical protein